MAAVPSLDDVNDIPGGMLPLVSSQVTFELSLASNVVCPNVPAVTEMSPPPLSFNQTRETPD